jgi:hypothetical protein
MIMRTQPTRFGAARIVLGALAVLFASALPAGIVFAQTKAPAPAPVPPPAGAASTQSPDWLRGRWMPADPAVCDAEIGPDYLASANQLRHGRVEAAFATTGDFVVVTVGRTLEPGPAAPPPGSIIVIRRVADGYQIIGAQIPGLPDVALPPQVRRPCS